MKNNYLERLKYPFIVIIFITLFVVAIQKGSKETKDTPYVNIGGQKIEVELAVTTEEHQKGLSIYNSLEPTKGMLFVFETPGKYSFWMQGMKFPIDIIWISEDMKIVYIKKNADHTKPFDQFGPSADAKYVLELVSGFTDTHNVKEGDLVEISR